MGSEMCIRDRSDTGAERAVDGQYTHLYLNGGQCAASVGGQTAEWWVDLGGIKNIHHVFLQHAAGSKLMLCIIFF